MPRKKKVDTENAVEVNEEVKEVKSTDTEEKNPAKKKSTSKSSSNKEKEDSSDLINREEILAHTANSVKKKKQVKSDDNTVITAENRKQVIQETKQREDERRIRTIENQSFYMHWLSLEASMKAKKIEKAKIVALEQKQYNGKNALFLVLLNKNGMKFLMLFDHIYKHYPIDLSTIKHELDTPEGQIKLLQRQRAMAEKLFGLVVPFIILRMDANNLNPENEYTILVSRKEALKIYEEVNYEPDENGKALIEKGSEVDCIITAIGRHTVAVDVGGVDTTIPIRDLTFRYISSPRELKELYQVGQKLRVKVYYIGTEDIKVTYADKTIIEKKRIVLVSAKEAELREAKARQSMLISVGMTCTGVITSVNKNRDGKVRIFLWLNQFEMPAVSLSMPALKSGKALIAGDQVRLKILAIREDGLLVVQCRGPHGAAGYTSKL